MKRLVVTQLVLLSLLYGSVASASISEVKSIAYENKISMPEAKKKELHNLTERLFNDTKNPLFNSYWRKYGDFLPLGVEVQGSLAYGMALADSSDLDIAFVYSYNHGSSMGNLNPVELKQKAVEAFKYIYGNLYNYEIKLPVVNLKNDEQDIDVAFFNVLSKDDRNCLVVNRCSELNYGKDTATAGWYLSERLNLYKKLDEVFTKNTTKRASINRAGKFFKIWRTKSFVSDEVKIPSIALVTIMYDFDAGRHYIYKNTIETLRDITNYSIETYFKGRGCSAAADAVINLPVYQKDRNLLGRMTGPQKIKTCQKLVDFNDALQKASSENVSEQESINILKPYIGDINSAYHPGLYVIEDGA
ncbi:hypothetical protein C7M52_00672 [Mixta theicola]|nr:hypothetical protein [Mixta theicola]QHM74730.1 hypothetical protein C7M52_00672 [Mixta theicola]